MTDQTNPTGVAQAVTVRLEARPADDSQDWTEIFPAQLEWVAKAGHKVRAIEIASQPPAAPVDPVVATIKRADELLDSAHARLSAETARQALDELRRDTKKLARELQQGLPKRNAAERLEAISASADRALAAQSSPAPVETDRTHVFEEAGFDTCRFCGERKSSKDHLPDLPQEAQETVGIEEIIDLIRGEFPLAKDSAATRRLGCAIRDRYTVTRPGRGGEA